MTAQVVYRVLGPKQIKQLQDVYERALAVRAKLPKNHLASIAAKKLTDAFEKPHHPDDTILVEKWPSEGTPQGSSVAAAEMDGVKRSRGRGSRISCVSPH